MKWKSHRAIALAISREAGLPPDLERALCEGSIEPDKRPDALVRVGKRGKAYLGRASHHTPPTGMIMAYVWRARKAYLLGNDYRAVKSLGRALHYVQDKCVHTGFMNLAHDSREAAIAELEPSPSVVRQGIDMAVCSPAFVKGCITKVRPRRDPQEAMFQATLYSSAIFASVFFFDSDAERFIQRYDRAVRGRKVRIWTALGLLAITVLLTFLLEQPLLIPVGAVAGASVIRFDPDYYNLKGSALWFGME